MSGTLLSIILSFRWAFSRSRSFKVTRSRKDQTENLGFGRRDTCFWVGFSSRTRKMILEHFLNGPNGANFENRENTENAENSVENGLFRPWKRQNSAILKVSAWNFAHIYTWHGSFTYINKFRCFDNSKNLIFRKIIFLSVIFLKSNSEYFENLK